MSLTAKQELPARPLPKVAWSQKAMFPARALAKTLQGIFLTPYDILLGLLVFAITVVEVFGNAPFMLYFLALAVLAASIAERYYNGEHIYKSKVEISGVPDKKKTGEPPADLPK